MGTVGGFFGGARRFHPKTSHFREGSVNAVGAHARLILDAACEPRFTGGSPVAPCPIHRG